MRALAFALMALALAACAAAPAVEVPERRANLPTTLPPMLTFSGPYVTPPQRSNEAMARDILDLTFQLESGRALPVLTRFEGPITVRVTGTEPPTLAADLERLLVRFRTEAGIDIRRVPAEAPASITVEVITRAELSRTVPQAACFVVPRVSSWDEFRRNRRSPRLDWVSLGTRETMAVFLPGDVSPQEIRDCLHEELAQAIGPLNDLYRLPDSVFNDDNFHTVLTGFDMLVLRTIYDPALRSGMTREAVADRLPAILDRLNPAGRAPRGDVLGPTPRDWIDAIETALGPRVSDSRRIEAARAAVRIAQAEGWRDGRYAFSLFVLGRLTLGVEPEVALSAFLQAGSFYSSTPGMEIQAAHVAMQLSAFALSAGQADAAIDIVNAHLRDVARAENAALLATLLFVKAEALELENRPAEAREVLLDSLGWARYGFGPEAEVRQRAGEIAALSPRSRQVATGPTVVPVETGSGS
ncbi:DUF2927 domain-containing protein [Palleronia sp. KMU-117]|uniref:DUF2927 domain-containing protein n=1 Tax=Palleronia sp. KMU-117 TaxID=3434108 RepID=UPI003D75DE84